MANGHAVRLPLELAPAPESKDVPPPTPSAGIIGTAVANAVTVFCQAAIDQQENGAIAPAIIAAGGDRIAAIALLQLDYAGGDIDFTRKAHEQGKCVLHRYLDANLFRQHGPGEVDKVLDMAIDSVFEIVSKVVKTERTFRAAWAN